MLSVNVVDKKDFRPDKPDTIDADSTIANCHGEIPGTMLAAVMVVRHGIRNAIAPSILTTESDFFLME